MTVPLLSPSGSVLASGAYVEESVTTPVTVNVVELADPLRVKFPSVQIPFAAVTQVTVPIWLLKVPLTVAPATATPAESRAVTATFGCHFFTEEVVVALSRSPT
jgi:hypothetical protein